MIKVTLSVLVLLFSLIVISQERNSKEEIFLLVRADDIGSFHAANEGCIASYQNGIARSVELMAPCAWFMEAVAMLNENQGYDVGVHLTLTSEWDIVKWRPLTYCPGLVDNDGYFFPTVRKSPNRPANQSIEESDWTVEEIEQELRAQIELSLKYVPHISHLSSHMGFESLDPRIAEVVKNLAKEYHLEVDMSDVKRFSGWGRNVAMEERIDQFCENLGKLTPGKYLFVEHPAAASDEMKTVGHKGYENVGADREWVTRVFTSEKVKQTLHQKGIKLISYNDLK